MTAGLTFYIAYVADVQNLYISAEMVIYLFFLVSCAPSNGHVVAQINNSRPLTPLEGGLSPHLTPRNHGAFIIYD
jgi:hypothetical protein